MMKITGFNPLIISRDANHVMKLFEELGFEKRHTLKANTKKGEISFVRMKNPDGFAVDVTLMKELPQDMTVIRMNVDDFDEGYRILTERGFKNYYGDLIIETDSAKMAFMQSPSGFIVELILHIKK
jgi:predicted RecB family endonuclease